MDTQKYNGWSNYATWRVKIEIIDGTNFVKEDISSSDEKLTIDDIASFLEENVVENAITNCGEIREGFALDYARSFLSDVNYHEIADSVLRDNPKLIEGYCPCCGEGGNRHSDDACEPFKDKTN